MDIKGYDAWKTTPLETKEIDYCESCGGELYKKQPIKHDHIHNLNFCDLRCFRNHVMCNVDDYIEELEDVFIEEKELV